jgi:hypothetical protein
MQGSDEKEEKEEMTRVHTADFPGLPLFCAKQRTHQAVSVVAKASTASGEKIKGRRKSMQGSDEKEEKEEMTRVHTADFPGLPLFCAPF